jgi:hypothetical protein
MEEESTELNRIKESISKINNSIESVNLEEFGKKYMSYPGRANGRLSS